MVSRETKRGIGMTKNLPVEAYHLAEAYSLGKPTRLYKTDFKEQVKIVAAAIGFLLLLCLSLVVCKVGFTFSPRNLQLYGIMAGCALVSSFISALFLIVPRFRGRNARVYICTHGLIYQQEHNT